MLQVLVPLLLQLQVSLLHTDPPEQFIICMHSHWHIPVFKVLGRLQVIRQELFGKQAQLASLKY